MKLMVMGYGRHGKDTFCELSGLPFQSSSHFAAETAVMPALGPKYGYRTVEECVADRAKHRAEWHQLIKGYNALDKARLSREIFDKFDIYCGIRCKQEFLAARDAGLFDLAIWVDASERLPQEDASSISVRPDHADLVVTNNGTLAELEAKVGRLMRQLTQPAIIGVDFGLGDTAEMQTFAPLEQLPPAPKPELEPRFSARVPVSGNG